MEPPSWPNPHKDLSVSFVVISVLLPISSETLERKRKTDADWRYEKDDERDVIWQVANLPYYIPSHKIIIQNTENLHKNHIFKSTSLPRYDSVAM